MNDQEPSIICSQKINNHCLPLLYDSKGILLVSYSQPSNLYNYNQNYCNANHLKTCSMYQGTELQDNSSSITFDNLYNNLN